MLFSLYCPSRQWRIIYSFALKVDYMSVRLLATTVEAALAQKEDVLSAKHEVRGLIP